MRALVFLVELLFWLMVIRLVLRGLARLLGQAPVFGPAPARPRAAAAPAPPRIEDLVQDPICRTYVPRSRALSARVAGQEQHFCSPACRDKALAAVARAS
jgi:hypothetical protein